MIIEASHHKIVRAEPLTLPRAGGDRDLEVEFFVSHDANLTTPDQRPYMIYRVNLQGDDPVHLILRINGDELMDQVIREQTMRTFHEVIGVDTLDRGSNTLVIRLPDDQPGTMVISEIVLVYAVHFLISTPEDDSQPTGGPL